MPEKSEKKKKRSKSGKSRRSRPETIDENTTVDSHNAVLQDIRDSAVDAEAGVGGGRDAEEASKLRIFDRKRISMIVGALIVIIGVAVGSSLGFAKPPSSFSTATATPPHPNEDGLAHL